MKRFFIAGDELKCELHVRDSLLEVIRINYKDGDTFLGNGYITLNEKKVVPRVEDLCVEQDCLNIVLVIGMNCLVLYSLAFSKGRAEEHIRLKYKKGFKPENFEFIWESDFGKAGVMPIPFANNSKKPEILTASNMRDMEFTCEGASVSRGEKGFAVAKYPSDEEPVWIKVSENSGKMLLTGASVSGNRGFYDEKSQDQEWNILDFHRTEYLLFTGGIEEGFYCYRDYMKEAGVTIPDNYNPPFNYCVYYECRKMDEQYGEQMRIPYECHSMTKQVILDMAEIAALLQCSLVYLDQGWDTAFGSLVWDEDRLGDTAELVEELKKGEMALGVLIPLHAGLREYEEEMYLRDREGKISPGDPWHEVGMCPCSSVYEKLRIERLEKLAEAGIRFFSYDFHDYKECFSENHGHSVPMTPYEHAKALAETQKVIKQNCRNVLLESHDWKSAGEYFYPVYMFSEGHHERWGFEYMWYPMEDYRTGRLQNLYFYNLAYEKPLYLHMDLLGMGENAEVFWYFASTVRHLGIGNFSALTAEKQMLIKEATAVYMELKVYYAVGIFYGKGPLVHIHKLMNKGAVINLFHDGAEGCASVILEREELGLERISGYSVKWGNASVEVKDCQAVVTTDMNNSDAVVIEIQG